MPATAFADSALLKEGPGLDDVHLNTDGYCVGTDQVSIQQAFSAYNTASEK